MASEVQIPALLAPRLRSQLNRLKRASRAERLAFGAFGLMGIAFWVALFVGMAWLVSTFQEVEIFGPIITRKLLELMLLSLFGLLIFSNVVTALSNFYLSDDLELVLSLPVRRSTFHYARALDTWLQSSWMMALFGLPVFVAYGIAHHAGWPYAISVLGVVPAFVALAGAIGVGVASILVRVFPARRVREGMVFGGVMTLGAALILLRLLKPERLLNAKNFESVAAYVAAVDAPVPLMAPPRWAAEVLQATLSGRPFPWVELALLLTGAVAMNGLARWLTAALYDEARSRAQEARAARLAKSGLLDRVLALLTRPLAPVAREIVIKDVKVFFRDPAQWTQVFLVGAIVLIVLASVAAFPVDLIKGPWMDTWRNMLAWMVLGLIGFVMSAVAARFQFTAVSSEGRAFWIVRTGPVDARRYLWAKVWPSLLPMLAVGELLALASTSILGAGPFLTFVAAGTALCLAFGISGIAVGMGAFFPDFKADNASRVASGPAGLLFMVAATTLVGVVVAIDAIPAWIVLRADFDHVGLSPLQWVGVVLPLLGVVGLCVAATVLPVERGARALWARELPNG